MVQQLKVQFYNDGLLLTILVGRVESFRAVAMVNMQNSPRAGPYLKTAGPGAVSGRVGPPLPKKVYFT